MNEHFCTFQRDWESMYTRDNSQLVIFINYRSISVLLLSVRSLYPTINRKRCHALFEKTFLYKRMKGKTFFLFLRIASSFFIYRAEVSTGQDFLSCSALSYKTEQDRTKIKNATCPTGQNRTEHQDRLSCAQLWYRDATCKDSKHAVLFCCSEESWWFLLCSSLSLSSRSLLFV